MRNSFSDEPGNSVCLKSQNKQRCNPLASGVGTTGIFAKNIGKRAYLKNKSRYTKQNKKSSNVGYKINNTIVGKIDMGI